MALDVTVAGTAANSYVSLIEANAYADARLGGFAEKWLSATTTDKEKALKQATRDVNNHVRASVRYLDTQALIFPRLSDLTSASVAFIPSQVKEATCEQAIYLLENADEIDHAASRRARGHISYNDDQGTGGTLALNPAFGLFSPIALDLISALSGTRERFAGTTVIRTRYGDDWDVIV